MKTSIFKKMAFALLFVLMFSSMSFATNGDLGGGTYDGSSSKPYQISDAADLKAFAKLVNDGVQTGASAVLTTDIDMNQGKTVLDGNGDLYNNGEGLETWTPIGTWDNRYTGTFDGKGYTIRGLYFNDEKTFCVGLFGYINESAKVQNVGVVDSYFNGSEYIGGVVGYNDGGTVSNVYNTGSVSGDIDVGGVVGGNDGTVSNVYNTGSVSGDYEVGGVVGYNVDGTVSNVYNTGSVSGTAYVGGVVGYNDNGTVSNVYNTGSVSGSDYVGGVVGFNGFGTVSNVYNTGSVSGSGNVGGVVGANCGTVSNVYNTGSVSGSGDDVGGVVGFNDGTVSNGFFNTAYYSGNAISLGAGTADNVKGLSMTDLANLAIGSEDGFPLLEGETVSPFLTGSVDVNNAVCKFPYLTGLGNQPQIEVVSVTINDINGNAELKTVTIPSGSRLSLAGVQMEDYGVFSLYKKVDDEFVEWNFEDGVKNDIELWAKYIRVADGVYQISNADELLVFASIVNSGETDIDGKLTADICLNACEEVDKPLLEQIAEKGEGNLTPSTFNQWTPIGTEEKQFVGKFDGNGKTVRGLYFNVENAGYVGLFGNVGENGVVQNVGVVDSYLRGFWTVGGVVGSSHNGTVSNVYNTGSVSGSGGDVGGVVGYSEGSVSNVYNTGSVSGDLDVGGVVGYNGGIVSNVYNTGFVNGEWDVGGVVGYNGGIVSNVYNTGSVSGSGDDVGGVVGFNDGTVSNGFFNTAYYSGNAISLGAGTADNVKGLSMTDLANLAIGSEDGFPLLEGETVSPFLTGSVDVNNAVCKFPYLQVFGEASQPQFNVVFITITNIDGGAELGTVAVNPNSKISLADVQVMENGEILSLYKDVEGVPTEWNFENDVVTENISLKGKCMDVLDGVYQIASAQELMFFASIVNGGKTDASAALTQDICLNACDENESVLKADGTLSDNASNFTQWTPIGTEYVSFTGTFDGNGHTIRGLYFNDESTEYVGLFGYIDESAKVQNVGVVDSYFKGCQYVGGVVGYNYNGTVSNVYNTGSVSGETFVGGVVGKNDNGVSNVYNTGSVSGFGNDVGGVVGNNFGTVSNAYNTGSVSGSGDDVGGVVGLSFNGTVSNVYNTGSVSGNGVGVGGVVGWNFSGTVSNAYYNTDFYAGNAVGVNEGSLASVEGKSTDDFHNGTVAMLLHDWCEKEEGSDECKYGGLNGSIWGQDLAAENSLPDFSGVVGFKYGSITFFNLNDYVADSASIDATAKNPVSIPENIAVSEHVTFKRPFAVGYSTMMLPFSVNAENKPAELEFYSFDKVEEIDGKYTASYISVTGLNAHTPYIVKNSGKDALSQVTFEGEFTLGTPVMPPPNSSSSAWEFNGTYEYKTWEEGDEGLGKTYGFAGSAGNDPKIVGQFAKVGAGAYIYPMRAYLEYTAPAPAGRPAANGVVANTVASLPDEIDVVIVDKDETSGEETTKVIGTINTRTGEFKFANDRWFDLQGRYLGNKKPTAKGAYYNNGKKVIVK